MSERSTTEAALLRWAKAQGYWAPKTEGLATGFPDRCLWIPGGEVVAVECKVGWTDLGPKQREWREHLQQNGFRHYVVYNQDDLAFLKRDL